LEGGRNAQRPCPYVGCRQHLLLDVTPGGHVRLTRGILPWEDDGLPTCALDIAEGLIEFEQLQENDRNVTLDVVGRVMGVTRERARQLEETALKKLRVEQSRLDQEEEDA